MKPAIHACHLTVLLAALSIPLATRADVVVIVNKTTEPVEFVATTTIAPPQKITVAALDLVTIPVRVGMKVSCPKSRPSESQLEANSAYYFFRRGPDEPLGFDVIDRPPDAETQKGRELGNKETWDTIGVIPVKLLVDDDERAKDNRWEKNLRERLANASDIFVRLFRVRFEVVAVGTWDSDDGITEFKESLREFSQEVKLGPARLAIGFTRQYAWPQSTEHLGGIPTVLHTHILVREWSKISEPERLEVLVHELGHFLGAAHSPETASVMRPKLADGQARQTAFRINFDPLNALAVYLLAEELRFREVSALSRISIGTALRLRQLYRLLADPPFEDAVAGRLVEILNQAVQLPPESPDAVPGPAGSAGNEGLSAAAHRIVEQLVVAARANAALPIADGAADPRPSRRIGDELTAYYVRQAAKEALAQEPELAPRALLLALGVVLADSDLLANRVLFEKLYGSIETEAERAERLTVLGQPTVHGRRDLAQHFFFSAFLTARYGPVAAESAGVAKELLDARGDSGFSFPDLAADLAGITFAKQTLAGSQSLRRLASSFTVADFVPSISELPEGLRWNAFEKQFGSVDDDRYKRLRRQIQDRVDQLPGYRAAADSRGKNHSTSEEKPVYHAKGRASQR